MRWLLLMAAAIVALTSPATADPPQNFIIHDAPAPVAELRFTDDAGKPHALTDFEGKVVLLNLWATWCVPCRKEMPALDRLQAALGGADFQVVALSLDRGGIEPVRRFYGEIGIAKLAIYLDRFNKTARSLAVAGLPTTLLIDRQGREVGRLVGPAEWDSPDMVAFLRTIISREEGRLPSSQQEALPS